MNSDTNCPFFANLAQGDYTPVEAFTANRVTALQGEAITFTSRIAGDAEWTFTGAGGNATTASGNPVSPVLAPGTYDVALAVGGATYTAAGAVKIGPASVSPATGADLLAAVATATDGTVIHLAADQYEITDTILLACRATIVGAGRDDTVLKMKSSANKRVVVLAHPDAVVSNLTLSGGRCNVYGPTRGISLWINKRGGRFTHGRVTASTTKSHYQYGAVGVSASSGYVGNCVIDGNYNIYQKNSGSSTGGGAYIEAGLMENCLISDNDAFYGAGFVIAGSGRVRNCTVVGNRAYKTGGGVYWNNGGQEVVNCVFMGNTAEADTTLGAPNWAPDTATAARYTAISNAFHACAFVGSVAASADSFVMNDPFLAYASGDYHPAAGTAGLVDKGQSYANPAATDLDGNARVQGGGIDIGCYEREALSTSVSFTAATVEAFSDTAVAFASEIVNPAPGITYGYNWSFTDRNGNAFSSSVSNPVVTLPAGWYTVALSIYDTANPSAVVESGARPDYLRLALRDIYLVPENPSAAFPYGSWATAGTNLFEALEWSMDGTAIHLGEGTFPTTNELIVAADVAISGRGWDKTTILLGPKAPNRRVATINSPGAVVEGVTLTGGRSDLNYGEHTTVGTGVLIGVLGGTLRNSRVTGNVSKHHYQHGAVAVIGASGLVDGCLIDGNRNTHREVSSHGGGLYLTKGEARNCVVTNNISNIGGGVSLDGGKIRNCTVAFNHAVHCTTKTINSNPPNYVGGYGGDFATKDGGGTAINCVFFGGDETPWDVSGQQSAETVVKEWVGNANASVTLRNCAFPSARGLPTGFKTLTATDCVLFGDPGFRSVGRGNVAIRASSPLRDAGSNAFAWPAPATDFAGNPRVAGKGVDIGAFECQAGPASVIFLQ